MPLDDINRYLKGTYEPYPIQALTSGMTICGVIEFFRAVDKARNEWLTNASYSNITSNV